MCRPWVFTLFTIDPRLATPNRPNVLRNSVGIKWHPASHDNLVETRCRTAVALRDYVRLPYMLVKSVGRATEGELNSTPESL